MTKDYRFFEIAIVYVSVTNTTPTAFWMLAYIFSNPELRAQVREEVTSIITRD